VKVTRLFEVERYPTLWQMTSTVRCSTEAGIPEIFSALFPAASITGAPKVRTMEIIAELESSPRRIYTGSIGYLGPHRRAQFNVAIRTVLIDKRRRLAEYGVGGGIVWDSVDRAEFEECATKARILTDRQPDFALLETILWTPENGYLLLPRHLRRLKESASYFGRPLDLEAVRERLVLLASRMSRCPHRIRLLVPREGEPIVESQAVSPLPSPYRIRLAAAPVSSEDPFLYHKTTHRQAYEQALARRPGYDDVLLYNEKGEITETCIANVAVKRDGQLLTPPVCCGLLPGTYRSWLLRHRKIQEQVLRLADLEGCGDLYLMNSLRGMWQASLVLEEVGEGSR
jgi:para-aminobenzoate synthetase/4-amino-4-deoxychorismate lyase